VITGLKSGGLPGPGGNGFNLETSLSPNDLSQFTASASNKLKFEFTDIFLRLRPGQFGPKGTYTCAEHKSCT